jgi:adenylate cyclase
MSFPMPANETRLKPEFSRDPEGRTPNQSFAAECNQLLTGFSG